MTQKPDGGPAFAAMTMGKNFVHAQEGMSLRDYFAGQALASFTGADDLEDKLTSLAATSSLSTTCYRIADAMIAARDA